MSRNDHVMVARGRRGSQKMPKGARLRHAAAVAAKAGKELKRLKKSRTADLEWSLWASETCDILTEGPVYPPPIYTASQQTRAERAESRSKALKL